MGKHKRSNKVFRDPESGKIVIDKKKKDLDFYERMLLKNNPNYTNKVSIKHEKEELSIEERLELRQKYENKKNRKHNEEFWKEVDRYEKNPKKYNKTLSKKEKRIMEFFRRKNGGKKKKLSKHDKEYKKAMNDILLYSAYIESKEKSIKHNLGIEEKNKNPNKRFMKNVKDRTYDAEKIALLETLEEEILNKLNDDFSPDNVVVRYESEKRQKKEKKKKKKDKKINPKKYII